MITLSEAYRKLNNKNTRRRVNEARIKVNDNMIPAALRQYFTISDYEPQLGEYQIGDVVDQNEVLAYLEPTPEYRDTIQIFPLLLKPILPPHARRGVYSTHPFVANVIHDRVYYVTDDDIHAELGESKSRSRRSRVNEAFSEDRELRDAVESKFMDFFKTLAKELTAEHHIIEGKPIVFDVGSFTTTYLPYFMDYLNASLNQVYKKNNVTPLYNKRYM